MATVDANAHTSDHREPLFVSTHWSVVLAAGKKDSSSDDALARLCETYWYPLYAYARRRGYSVHDSQDLTQEFFARLLEGNWLAKANRERGRFRSFLLSSMKNFMANEWKKARMQKRGGGHTIVSFDDDSAEGRYKLEPMEKRTPESFFERQWALTLLETVLARLEAEHSRENKDDWMTAMRPALTSERDTINCGDIAQKLAITETAARVAVHRLRRRYRQLIRAEVAATVASPADIEMEMRHLFQSLTQS